MSVLRHVYVVKAETGLVKIGFTATPEKRLKEIRRSIGSKIVEHHVSSACANARQLERLIHRQFAEYRREGEWFTVDFQTVVAFLGQQTFLSGQPNQIVPFVFQKQILRVFVDKNGKLWFCLKDTAEILEIGNSRQLLTRLKKKGVISNDTLTKGGTQKLIFIDEPNFYRVIFQSRKPEAEVFQDWVFEDVLPTLRKTGQYTLKSVAVKKPEQIDFEEFAKACFIVDAANVVKARDIYLVYQDWCQRQHRPIFTPQWLGLHLRNAGYRRKKCFHGIQCWYGLRLNSPVCSNIASPSTLHGAVHEVQEYLSALCKVLSDNELLSLVHTALQKALGINQFLVPASV